MCLCLRVVQRLNALAALVRGQLPSLHRNIITALITIDVHARDIVSDLVRQKVKHWSVNAIARTHTSGLYLCLFLAWHDWCRYWAGIFRWSEKVCNNSPLFFQVDSRFNFEWQRQLRYYWDLDQDTCVATMALSTYIYGYEYLGACPRLVITPLTVAHSHIYTQTHNYDRYMPTPVWHKNLFMLYFELNCSKIKVGTHTILFLGRRAPPIGEAP